MATDPDYWRVWIVRWICYSMAQLTNNGTFTVTWMKINRQLMRLDAMKVMLSDSEDSLREYLFTYLNTHLGGHSDQPIDHCFNTAPFITDVFIRRECSLRAFVRYNCSMVTLNCLMEVGEAQTLEYKGFIQCHN